jgi:hypothetical protein
MEDAGRNGRRNRLGRPLKGMGMMLMATLVVVNTREMMGVTRSSKSSRRGRIDATRCGIADLRLLSVALSRSQLNRVMVHTSGKDVGQHG